MARNEAVGRASEWFWAGVEDGAWGTAYMPPPPSAGAQARADYDIGHNLGEREPWRVQENEESA